MWGRKKKKHERKIGLKYRSGRKKSDVSIKDVVLYNDHGANNMKKKKKKKKKKKEYLLYIYCYLTTREAPGDPVILWSEKL